MTAYILVVYDISFDIKYGIEFGFPVLVKLTRV